MASIVYLFMCLTLVGLLDIVYSSRCSDGQLGPLSSERAECDSHRHLMLTLVCLNRRKSGSSSDVGRSASLMDEFFCSCCLRSCTVDEMRRRFCSL